MKFLNSLVKFVIIVISVAFLSNCCCPDKPVQQTTPIQNSTTSSISENTTNSNNPESNIPSTLANSTSGTNTSASGVNTPPNFTSGMKFGFSEPVVAVNGKQAIHQEWQESSMIEVIYPENSTQDIALTIISPEGQEEILNGKIQVLQHTAHTKPGTLIHVVPDDREMTYYNILQNGYGEITVTEYIQYPGRGEEKGQILAQIFLGSKKKNSSGIEFRFRDQAIDSNSVPSLSFAYPENSTQTMTATLDQGEVKITGEFQVMKGNFYTLLAPVWITLSAECLQALRRNGEITLALYVPSVIHQQQEPTTVMVSPEENPLQLAERYGTLVALVTFRRTY